MPRRATPRLSEALAEYLAIRRTHLAANTYLNDVSVLRRFVVGVGDPHTGSLTARACEGWFAAEAGRSKASSYNKVASRTRLFLGFCARRGWLSSDPLSEVRPRRVDREQRMHLSPAQLLALLDGAEPRDRAMLATAANTALRASDLTGLRISSVDLDAGWLNVRIQKTGKVDRLPITTGLDGELRRWLTAYADVLAEQGFSLRLSDYLFPASRPPKPIGGLTPAMLTGLVRPDVRMTHPARIVHRALDRLGLDGPGEGWHTIRRSVASALLEHASDAGEDQALRTVQALLGHASSQTTELYLNLDRDRRRRDELLRGRDFLVLPSDNVVPLERRG